MRHYGDVTDVPAMVGSAPTEVADEGEQPTGIKRPGTWMRLRRQRVTMLCLLLIVLFVLAAILAPWLAPHNPNFQYDAGLSDSGAPVGPSAQFPLGTDTDGRDVLSRLLFGARISLTVGLLATLLTATLGVVLSVAG